MKNLLLLGCALASAPAFANDITCVNESNGDIQLQLHLGAGLESITLQNIDWGTVGFGQEQLVTPMGVDLYVVESAPAPMIGLRVGAELQLIGSQIQPTAVEVSGNGMSITEEYGCL